MWVGGGKRLELRPRERAGTARCSVGVEHGAQLGRIDDRLQLGVGGNRGECQVAQVEVLGHGFFRE